MVKIITNYTSIVFKYDTTAELNDHAAQMERDGWEITKYSPKDLTARFRKDHSE